MFSRHGVISGSLEAEVGGGRARAYVNLILVMLVAGLWREANWTFVLWGAVHGTAIALERAFGFARGPRTRLAPIVWYLLVQMTWILSLGIPRRDSSSTSNSSGPTRERSDHLDRAFEDRVSVPIWPIRAGDVELGPGRPCCV